MDNLFCQRLYNRMTRKLLNVNWLEKFNININVIEEYVKNQIFLNGLKLLTLEKDYSCKRALYLCEGLLNKICDFNIPKDWLSYIYEYVLSKSFPEAVSIILIDNLNSSCELYLRILKVLCEAQIYSEDDTWQSKYPLVFLTSEEEDLLEHPEEYKKFLKAFKHNYTYEMMKLNGEIYGFNTLDHICGVHYLSLFIGRQLKKLGLPIDLGRVSGAAAGHDIGKYGCKRSELKRVPYLHYYYSDQWFKRYSINYIRNIAINHSTWDLELENLSLESLILIYSDFRVKNVYKDSDVKMNMFSLNESFEIILKKLDNVDDAKEKRYRRVYEKLKDFEDYLISIGINTEPKDENINLNVVNIKNYSLLQGKDVIQNLKYMAINHNINLMYKLRDEYSLETILEAARSETDWKNFREYISILEEYSTYLTQNQKLQAIKFLFENLVHPEDDIRRHCAELLGTLIAIFDEDYRKEIPENVKLELPQVTSCNLLEEYMELMLFPSYKVIPEHKFLMGYNISIFVNSLFSNCKQKSLIEYRNIIFKLYNENIIKNKEAELFLLESIKYIPLEPFDESLKVLFDFIVNMMNKRSSSLRLSALEAADNLIHKLPHDNFFVIECIDYLLKNPIRSSIPSENQLKYNLIKTLNIQELSNIFMNYCKLDEKNISEIFLSNLKTATDWIKKRSQIILLLNYSIKNIKDNGIHTTIHFCNLLKVSAIEEIRNTAGCSILELMPKLSLAERNEVAVELLRALEIEGNRFTEYIPTYVGQVILWLQPIELNEIIDDLKSKIKNSSINVKSLVLKTVGVSISNYTKYRSRFSDSEENFRKRLIDMLGILLNSLGDHEIRARQAAISIIGKDIFGTDNLSLDEKEYIFKLIAKKLLTMVTDSKNEELLFLTNSAALNHIYRFISDYFFLKGNINIPKSKKIAFFPGAFDPFTLSHKEIAKLIRDKGFEVHLAVDEFSWSKKTLPNKIRRKIITMSIADELNIYVYPENLSVNIANPLDIKQLKDNFSDSEVYLVVGSDVVLNASSYKLPKGEFTVHSLNHIIFERGKSKKFYEAVKNIDGKIEYLSLPAKYSTISSSQIRNYIDQNRDISSLIDPLVQQYIYKNGFYQSEPQEKSFLSSLWLKIEILDNIREDSIDELVEIVNIKKENLKSYICQTLKNPSGRIAILEDTLNNEILGFSLFHGIDSRVIYEEFKDVKLSQYIREHSIGRVILINCMAVKNNDKYKEFAQILMTETLAFSLSKDYQYAVFKNLVESPYSSTINELLELQGFNKISSPNTEDPTYVVNMSAPCVLNLDIENVLKEPFRSNNKIKSAINSTRKKLQIALTKLYPGELVLSFDSSMLHQSMIRNICAENNVPIEAIVPKKLGAAMCVPYGDILERYVIPNTVTKALHTEKIFQPNINNFSIGEFPNYLSLENQVKMLKSFKMPVILVDNILHKGYRMKALDPLFKAEGIQIKKIISGILSGRGKDLMDMQNREVSSVYFIPRLKVWFNENSLYPFIGGDYLWRGNFSERNLLPSVNLIIPYAFPTFIKNCSTNSIYNLSKVCIENSLNILLTIENEYHIIHERNLSLHNLGQVFTIPRCPDKGKNMDYDLNLSPSQYIKNDLELLIRFDSVLNKIGERS